MLTPPPSTMPVMPRPFISRKNFLEPSTCCSMVGFGSLSKILPSALPSGVDHAGRLVAVTFELAAGRDIGIVADVERLHGFWRQQQPVVEMLDVDGIVGRQRRHFARGSGGASRRIAPRSSRRRRRSMSRAFALSPPGGFSPAPLSASARRSSSLRCRRSAPRGCRGCGRRSGRESRCGRRDRSALPCRPRVSSSRPRYP